eukprot:6207484-Pleurochrysis_carterae.AAC.2
MPWPQRLARSSSCLSACSSARSVSSFAIIALVGRAAAQVPRRLCALVVRVPNGRGGLGGGEGGGARPDARRRGGEMPG